MFGPRSPRYPMLKAYLDARPVPSPFPTLDKGKAWLLVGALLTFMMGIAAVDKMFIPSFALIALGCGMGFFGFSDRKKLPLTPEGELARRADEVAKRLREHASLHRALHPAVGATLEECAGYWGRIVAALDDPRWRGDDAAHWARLREEALLSAELAMDEAIVHAGATLILVPPARPLDHVSDALEDVGFGPLVRDGRDREPMPPSFRPVRDLAERLRELAGRCETAATQRREESAEPISAAFRRLDATLGEMRGLEEAEGELKQGA